MHILTRETVINRNIKDTFDFFTKAENLNLITPPELKFRMLTPLPVKMGKGTIIDYKISLSGISFKWQTEITYWEPPYRFIDIQAKGPYKVWIHEHTFEETEFGTLMKDKVDFLSPGWFLEPLINRFFVQKKIDRIFNYRSEQFKNIFKP